MSTKYYNNRRLHTNLKGFMSITTITRAVKKETEGSIPARARGYISNLKNKYFSLKYKVEG